MTAKSVANAAAAQSWCPFAGAARGANAVAATVSIDTRAAYFKAQEARGDAKTDRCLVGGCCVWQDDGNSTGHCGLVAG